MKVRIETEQEVDGRWIAEAPEMPGVMAYGASQIEAISHVKALALRVLADRIENESEVEVFDSVDFVAA